MTPELKIFRSPSAPLAPAIGSDVPSPLPECAPTQLTSCRVSSEICPQRAECHHLHAPPQPRETTLSPLTYPWGGRQGAEQVGRGNWPLPPPGLLARTCLSTHAPHPILRYPSRPYLQGAPGIHPLATHSVATLVPSHDQDYPTGLPAPRLAPVPPPPQCHPMSLALTQQPQSPIRYQPVRTVSLCPQPVAAPSELQATLAPSLFGGFPAASRDGRPFPKTFVPCLGFCPNAFWSEETFPNHLFVFFFLFSQDITEIQDGVQQDDLTNTHYEMITTVFS